MFYTFGLERLYTLNRAQKTKIYLKSFCSVITYSNEQKVVEKYDISEIQIFDFKCVNIYVILYLIELNIINLLQTYLYIL